MSDIPLASYEDPRWFPANKNIVGNRGFTGVPASLTTVLTGTNNDLVISAKDCFAPSDPPIKVQYAVLAPGAPSALYEDGYPAILAPATDLGFQIIMKKAGSWGNYFTFTLINPGRLSTLSIRRPAAKDVVIRLANSGAAVTTTPALLIAAINADPELGEYMTAFASSATASALPAMAQKAFIGGSDVPGLVLVSLASNTSGAVTGATGATTAALLNGSRYVTAVNSGADTGAGAVIVMGATALTAGTANRGEVADANLTKRKAWAHRRRAGDPLGKEHNKTLQLRDSRFGAPRTYQRVPKQDRAVVTSSFQNHASDTLAAHSLG